MLHRIAPLLYAVAIAGGLAACGADAAPAPLTRVPDGQYGGEGVGLDVTAGSTSILLDCAGGHVDGPLTLTGDGTFDVTGTFTGGGNAVNADRTPHPARYRGRATRDVVRLTFTDLTTGRVSDTLVAVLGGPRFVVAC